MSGKRFHADRQARIVIIGGGVIGLSLAWHLAGKGENDVVVLEKARITEGSTWHAAGLVGQLRGKRNLTRLMQNSVSVFDRLEAETGQAIDWHKVGSLRLASSPDRLSEIRRAMSQAASFGVECHLLSAGEARDLFGYITTDGVEGAAFIPGDGYVDPYALAQAFATGARSNGVKIEEGVQVEDIVSDGRRVQGVVTNGGNYGCDMIVNCAGIWARRVGAMAGAAVAAGVVEHQYFITEKALDFDKSLPTLRDPDNNFYLKPDTGAFAIGGWEDGAPGCWRQSPPFEFGRELFAADMDRLEKFALPCSTRLPVLNDIGIHTVINGPIPVSPDGEPVMGPHPDFDNFFVACGFTAGIAASGGAGEAMANWIIAGDPGMDLWAFDVSRFYPLHANPAYLEARACEAYGAYYKIHWPGEETGAGRGLRRSPLYGHTKAAGAVFGARGGFERPNWFAAAGEEARDVASFEGKPNWFSAVARECAAIRQRVALIDQSSFAKIEISGADALAALQRICVNDVGGPPGSVTYTQMCNASGGIEADVTIMRRSENTFWMITGAGFAVHDTAWVRGNLEAGEQVALRDITGAYAVINLVGPKAREVLAAASWDEVSNEGLPFLAGRDIGVGLARVWAARVGYVGELGYELYVPQEFAPHVYETLVAVGERFAIANAGYRAIDSCRLEKGYLYWSGDISPDYNPIEAGIGFCVRFDKGDFIGRAALEKVRRDGPTRRLVVLAVDGFAPLHGAEPVYAAGELVGSTTSCGYGHAVGKTIAYAWLPAELAGGEAFEIEAFGKRHKAHRGPRALYDAGNERLKM